jgi:GNAT superfamily N-acetyltransferase
MVAGLGGATLETIDPHIRAIDAWRDGAAVADLLEVSFREEGIDDNGQRMIRMLRSYGPVEALIMEGAPGFVWVENGQVLGNASVQYNPSRRGFWIVGNVATHPDHRSRGIGSALIGATIQFARARNARGMALQVMEGNAPAIHLYEKYGFRAQGAVTYYQRPSVRVQPVWHDVSSANAVLVRKATWADSDNVWRAVGHNIPDELTYADPFDSRMYRLGMRWSLVNWFGGNREHWWVAESGGRFIGALRTRVNLDMSQHNVELMLQAQAAAAHGIALLERALKHFEAYAAKPLLATQARPHVYSHEALQAVGFKPTRTLIHMKLEL